MPSQLPALKLSTAPLSPSLPCCFHLLNTDQIIFLHAHHWCCFNLSLFNSCLPLPTYGEESHCWRTAKSMTACAARSSTQDVTPLQGLQCWDCQERHGQHFEKEQQDKLQTLLLVPPLPTALTCSPSDGLACPSHGQGTGHMMLEQHKEHQAQDRDTPEEQSSAQAARALTSLQGNDPSPRPLWPCDRREAVQDCLSQHDTCSLLKEGKAICRNAVNYISHLTTQQ